MSKSPIDKQKLFISKAAWYSIEINIHCLTSIVLLVAQGQLPEYALNIHLFSSQPCESTFRNARALTGTFSSITNFSVHQFLRKTEKLSLLNNIKSSEETNDASFSLKFPVHHKNKRADTNATIYHQNATPISNTDIEKIVVKAYKHALKLVNCLQLGKILHTHRIDDLNTMSSFIFRHLTKTSKTVDHSKLNSSVRGDDSSDDDSSDDDDDENDDDTYENLHNEEESDEEPTDTLDEDIDQMKTVRQTFNGMRIYDHVDPSNMHQYFEMTMNNKKKYIHKQTAAHMLTNNKNHLSSDRISRVQQMK